MAEAAEESEWLVALKRESVLSPLAVQSRPGAQRVEEAALELGLRHSVVYDLLRRFRQRSQTSSILPGKRGREPKVVVLSHDRAAEFVHRGILFETGAPAAVGSQLGDPTAIRGEAIAGAELPHSCAKNQSTRSSAGNGEA